MTGSAATGRSASSSLAAVLLSDDARFQVGKGSKEIGHAKALEVSAKALGYLQHLAVTPALLSDNLVERTTNASGNLARIVSNAWSEALGGLDSRQAGILRAAIAPLLDGDQRQFFVMHGYAGTFGRSATPWRPI